MRSNSQLTRGADVIEIIRRRAGHTYSSNTLGYLGTGVHPHINHIDAKTLRQIESINKVLAFNSADRQPKR
jgi:hypothetical protein